MRFHFGSNLKMNHTAAETRALVSRIRNAMPGLLRGRPGVRLWIAVSHTNIEAAADEARGSELWIGSQDAFWEDAGAFTGEVSTRQVKACGASFVMLGHAERRRLFGETDERLRLKVNAAARAGLRILLCVGEMREAKESGEGGAFVARQLEVSLADLASPAGLLVLYEPAWSIGKKGKAAAPAYAGEAMARIRDTLTDRFGPAGARVPVLYGGSVTAANVARYASLPGCAGVGVGRAAWTAKGFIEVLRRSLGSRTRPGRVSPFPPPRGESPGTISD